MVASADHGDAHDSEEPYGFDPAAASRRREPLRGATKADTAGGSSRCSREALGDRWRAEFLSYEASTYFGMLCAAYVPN
jgi:aromatic ring-opening dioxygenase LigB subunit